MSDKTPVEILTEMHKWYLGHPKVWPGNHTSSYRSLTRTDEAPVCIWGVAIHTGNAKPYGVFGKGLGLQVHTALKRAARKLFRGSYIPNSIGDINDELVRPSRASREASRQVMLAWLREAIKEAREMGR